MSPHSSATQVPSAMPSWAWGLFGDVAIEACIRMDADEGLFACVCQADGRRTTMRILLSGKSV